ncbi:hypothetical protein BC830DRAFT_519044 [Chytriomyces sp. MP71]|nr:hypothetical protein BC830DRAFT_519044 [Chytriomyces sp. MP71]
MSTHDAISALLSSPVTSPRVSEKAYKIKRRHRQTSSSLTACAAPALPALTDLAVEHPIAESADRQLSPLTPRHPRASKSTHAYLFDELELDAILAIESADARAQSKEVSSKLFKPLFETSKKLVGQMQNLMAYRIRIEPTDAQNFTRLAYKINCVFENQRAINLINARLFAISYMTNIFNFSKTRAMQKSLARGRQQIVQLETTVEALHEESQRHLSRSEHLKGTVDTMRVVLTKTLMEQAFSAP